MSNNTPISENFEILKQAINCVFSRWTVLIIFIKK